MEETPVVMWLWLGLAGALLCWAWAGMSRRAKLPPGPRGLPLLGYLPWIDPAQPYRSLTDLVSRFGPVYGLYMGPQYTVVVSEPRLIRQALAQHVFTARADLYLTHGMMEGYGLIVAQGERWKEQRKFVLSTLKDFGMVKIGSRRDKMEHRIMVGVQETLYILQSRLGQQVDIAKILLDTMGNIMNSIVFGVRWDPDDRTWTWLKHLAEEGVKHIGVAGPLNFFPLLRFLPKYRQTLKFILEGKAETHEVYKKLLATRQLSDEQDVASAFMAEMGKGFFDEKQLYHLLADLWGAGVETTMSTLRWYFLFMAVNPNIQAKVQEEIDSVLGTREPKLEDMNSLPYLEASLAEAQRIRSVTPLGIPHAAAETTQIEGYTIPKGTMLVPLQWAVHMDPTTYPNPQQYDPSRFLDENHQFSKPEAFIPFQTGKRSCVGEELAKMIMFLFGCSLLQNFTVGPGQGCQEAIDGICGITLMPGDHTLVFSARNKC